MPPVSDSATSGHAGALGQILRSPALLTRETLAGVLTALALIPEVISFSVIAGVDPKVSLIASVVLCLAMSVLGGRPAMVTAAAGSVALVNTASATFCRRSCWQALFKFCLAYAAWRA